MTTAKLIDLVMNFVIYPWIVIMYTIVEQCFIHIVLTKAVNNLKAKGIRTCKLVETKF